MSKRQDCVSAHELVGVAGQSQASLDDEIEVRVVESKTNDCPVESLSVVSFDECKDLVVILS